MMVVRAITVYWDFDVRLFKRSFVRQLEFEIFDRDATFQPHAFVVGADVGE